MSMRYGNVAVRLTGPAAVDRAIAGGAEAPLSNGQKAHICMLARELYPDESQVPFDEWRRSEQLRAVGIASLRAAQNQHYLQIVAHFEDLLGRSGSAFRRVFKAQTEPRLAALHHLYAECAKAQDVLPKAIEYARGFLRNRRHVALEDADAKALWHAVFTVRSKAQALRKGARPPRNDNEPF